jgi:uncharacterized oligopeptide transporter (OPT) family protein
MSAPRYREVTISAVVLGVVIGAIMNAAITYAGLKLAFTISGSAIAAVLGFGVLRGMLRKGSILETNIVQTVASAVNIPNSGVIFTVPVLILLGYELTFDSSIFWLILLACIVGSVLGVAFIIPVRKQMIDIDRLRFPSGTAVAAILKSPGAGSQKSLVLLVGALIAAVIYLPVMLPKVKLSAALDELDGLVAAEKITLEQAEQARQIASWVASRQFPQDLIDKGRREHQRIESGAVQRSKSDQFSLLAYEINAGWKDWSELEAKYWPRKPLWGYSDLNWRLSAPRPADPTSPEDGARYQQQMRQVDRDDPTMYGHHKPDLLLTDEALDAGRLLGFPDYLLLVFAITPLSFGAGYLTGKPGLLILAGGVLAYWVLTPAAHGIGLMPAWSGPGVLTAAHEVPELGRQMFNRPLGIGMLLGGALMGVLFALPALRAAFKSIVAAAKTGASSDELGLRPLAVAVVVCGIGLFIAADLIQPSNATSEPGQATPSGWLGGLNSHVSSLIVAVLGLVWIWFAGIIIAQCTGMTDWSPISGMALITVVGVLALVGTGNVLGAVLIGATLCVAVTCASDMMEDLKTGHLVGALPRRQQLVELLVTGLGPLIALSVVVLLTKTHTFGGTDLPAPQAKALETVIRGAQGGGDLPHVLYGAGALLAMGLGLGAFPGLGVLVGLSMYLPIDYVLPYGLGCLANMGVARWKGADWAEEWGVPFCAGLIVGEAVIALVFNMIAVAMS